MEHSPPPFFKRGPAPLVRLFFFASLSLALLVIDARFRYAEGLRAWLALAAYPIQRAATAPSELVSAAGSFLSTQTHLVAENERLRAQALDYSRDAQRYEAAQVEARQLRKLVEAQQRIEVRTIPAEVMYNARDPYSHKLFIDRGATQGRSEERRVGKECRAAW